MGINPNSNFSKGTIFCNQLISLEVGYDSYIHYKMHKNAKFRGSLYNWLEIQGVNFKKVNAYTPWISISSFFLHLPPRLISLTPELPQQKETLFINSIKPSLNTKDEYRSQTFDNYNLILDNLNLYLSRLLFNVFLYFIFFFCDGQYSVVMCSFSCVVLL